MSTGGRRIAATVLLLTAGVLLVASSASANTLGSNLTAAPNAGICPVEPGATEASCTFVQATLSEGHSAGGKLARGTQNVITGWRVYSGVPSPGTTSVKLRLHLLDPVSGFSFASSLPYVEMPLTPGVHEFPAQVSIFGPMLVGLDVLVSGSGGEASAPIAFSEGGVGTAWKWTPALRDGPYPPPNAAAGNTEVLFNYDAEPDRDNDGFGDRTRDRCPEDGRRQSHCDRTPPRVRVRYGRRQGFLGKKNIVMYVRSSEPGKIYASGQIELPQPSVTWGIYGDSRRVGSAGHGGWVRLALHVPAQAREHAARSFAHGRRVFAKVFVSAVDRFGNQSHATVVTVKPR